MTNRKRRSLKFKLAFFATLLVVFVAVSFSTFILQGQKRAIIKTQEENRVGTVKGLRQVAREAILVQDDTDMVNFVKLLKRSQPNGYAMILEPNGQVRVHTDPTLIGKNLTDAPTRKALTYQNRASPLTQNLTLTEDGMERQILDLSLPLIIGYDPPEFLGTVRVGFDKKAIKAGIDLAYRREMRRIVWAFCLALLIGLVGALILATLITRPLATLKAGSQKIGEGKLDHRIHITTNDELEDLADEFNLMGQKLGELDEMKRDFVSSVTHELRSPMTSIRGYMDLLLNGAAGNLSSLQKDYLSVIKNNAVRLGRFIDNLLDVAKIEAQKLKLTPDITDVHQLGHEMVVLFKPQVDEKKIQLVNEVPKNLQKAFVDKDRIAEVLINLTSNAIKFTPDKGKILISGKEGPNYIELGVHDSGLGIPDGQADKLFNKFEQVQAHQKQKGTKKAQKGTGLGLAIVKGIIEAHGGKIWVKSPGALGKGSSFYFTIPKLTPEIKEKLNPNV